MLHAFVCMRTFPEGVGGIYEVMLFTLRPCDAYLSALRPSDVVGPSEESEGIGYPPTLRTGQKNGAAAQFLVSIASHVSSLFC